MGLDKNKYMLFAVVAIAMSLPIGTFCTAQTNENTGASESVIELQKGTALVFAGPQQAKERLTTKDDFIKNLSPFDRSARMKTDKSVSQEEYLKFIAEQVLPWTAGEKDRINGMVESIANRIKSLKLNLPPKILLVKTTGWEEGGASYCRPNAIILPQGALTAINVDLEKVLIHELFHIISTNNSKLKEALYEVINFNKCNDIELPEKIREIKITNPDGFRNDHYVEVKYEDGVIQVVPILYSYSEKYDVTMGGEFFFYLRVNLLAVEKTGDKWRYKRDDNGEPVLLELEDVPDYYDKIGLNTDFVIHPDEILAENFVLMVQGTKPVKTEWVIEKMKIVFQKEAGKSPGIS